MVYVFCWYASAPLSKRQDAKRRPREVSRLLVQQKHPLNTKPSQDAQSLHGSWFGKERQMIGAGHCGRPTATGTHTTLYLNRFVGADRKGAGGASPLHPASGAQQRQLTGHLPDVVTKLGPSLLGRRGTRRGPNGWYRRQCRLLRSLIKGSEEKENCNQSPKFHRFSFYFIRGLKPEIPNS